MKILDLYIGKILFSHVLVTVVVLLGLFTFVSFLDELGDFYKGIGKIGGTGWLGRERARGFRAQRRRRGSEKGGRRERGGARGVRWAAAT